MKITIFPLFSGGIDSTIAVISALSNGLGNKTFDEVHPLFINYGQRTVENEWRAAARVYEKISEFFKDRPIKFSKLTRINLNSDSEDPNRLFHWSLSQIFLGDPHGDPYVENRNMVLLSVAASFAETELESGDEGIILTGFRKDFADTKQEFTDLMNEVFGFVYSGNGKQKKKKIIRIENPVIKYGSKKDMLKDFENYLDIIIQSWSCYVSTTEEPCGMCDACVNRAAVFS